MKTWKRESAIAALAVFWGNVTAISFGYSAEAAVTADLLKSIAMPVHMLAAGMFGIDWYGKQKS